jgi:hypothetical protein
MYKELIQRLPLTLGGSIGGALGGACMSMIALAARLHGLDPGVPLTEETVGAAILASAFIGDSGIIWLRKASVKRAIRRQVKYLRKRADAIADFRLRSLVRERLDYARADWDAGFLTDSILCDRVLAEIYLCYIKPLDGRISTTVTDSIIATKRHAPHATLSGLDDSTHQSH